MTLFFGLVSGARFGHFWWIVHPMHTVSGGNIEDQLEGYLLLLNSIYEVLLGLTDNILNLQVLMQV